VSLDTRHLDGTSRAIPGSRKLKFSAGRSSQARWYSPISHRHLPPSAVAVYSHLVDVLQHISIPPPYCPGWPLNLLGPKGAVPWFHPAARVRIRRALHRLARVLEPPAGLNHIWALDFMADSLHSGRTIGSSSPLPPFTEWYETHGDEARFIQPEKQHQNAFIEHSRRVPRHPHPHRLGRLGSAHRTRTAAEVTAAAQRALSHRCLTTVNKTRSAAILHPPKHTHQGPRHAGGAYGEIIQSGTAAIH